jgi:hypothetical protein
LFDIASSTEIAIMLKKQNRNPMCQESGIEQRKLMSSAISQQQDMPHKIVRYFVNVNDAFVATHNNGWGSHIID